MVFFLKGIPRAFATGGGIAAHFPARVTAFRLFGKFLITAKFAKTVLQKN